MRSLVLSLTVLAGLVGASVVAHAPASAQGARQDTNAGTGARPGNDIGTGMSLPLGTRASNIDQSDTRSQIAPNLPSPVLGPDAGPDEYLRAAQQSLQAGRTGEAQQSLEMAETRLLDRSVPLGGGSVPDQNPVIGQINQALRALASGDRAKTMQLIQAAIPGAVASSR